MRARVPTPRQSQLTKPSSDAKHLPRPYKLRRFYLASEVAMHNTKDDCWVSLFGQVFDLTRLLQENFASELCDPITLSAGTDVTHWFDSSTKEPKTFIDPVSNTKQVYSPLGRYLHLMPADPDSEFANQSAFNIVWWRDLSRYMIGNLTSRSRKIRLINMLTKHEDTLEVASEETMNEILDRYLDVNNHASSYTWKRLGRELNMDRNLS